MEKEKIDQLKVKVFDLSLERDRIIMELQKTMEEITKLSNA